jgi:FKBP-type peptidyl-prolyl cis-trans isomerase FkpA
MKQIIVLIALSLFATSCAKNRAEEQAATDEKIIQDYITANDLEAVATGSGLYYVRTEVGTGASCNQFSTVTVAYKGFLTDGTVFDESPEEGISFGLQSVIQGWTEGIPYFKEGGKGILLIPSALGYGNKSVGTIPKNAVLIFEIELIEVL